MGPQHAVAHNDPPGEREHETNRVLGHGVWTDPRAVDDRDACPRGRGDIDVVESCARRGDDLEARRRGDHARGDAGRQPDDDRIGGGQGRGEAIGRRARRDDLQIPTGRQEILTRMVQHRIEENDAGHHRTF